MDQQGMGVAGLPSQNQAEASVPNPDLMTQAVPIEQNVINSNMVMIPMELLANLVNERRELRRTKAALFEANNLAARFARDGHEQRLRADQLARDNDALTKAIDLYLAGVPTKKRGPRIGQLASARSLSGPRPKLEGE